MRYMIPFIILLSLSACNNTDSSSASKGAENKPSIKADRTVTVNVTFDRQLDFPVRSIAVVPNNVAPWAGSLFLIDSEQTLRRGAIDSGPFEEVARNISGMAPLARKNSAGIIMARTVNGKLKAFLEINDESNYAPIQLGQTPKNVNRFCNSERPDTNRAYAKSGQDIIALELVSPQENSYIGSAPIDGVRHSGDNCNIAVSNDTVKALSAPDAAIDTAILPGGALVFTTSDSQNTPQLYIKTEDEITALEIVSGLSTAAPSRIDSFYITPDPLGGVLRNGALIAADNETQRLIYISLDFLTSRLEAAETPATP